MVTQQLHNCLSKNYIILKLPKFPTSYCGIDHDIMTSYVQSDLFINQQLHSYITVSVKIYIILKLPKFPTSYCGIDHDIMTSYVQSDLFIDQQLHSYITVSKNVQISKYTKFHNEKKIHGNTTVT